MPEITFRREISQDQHDLLQTVLKQWDHSLDEFIWSAIVGDIVGYVESADKSPLYDRAGFVKEQKHLQGSSDGDDVGEEKK